MIFDWIGAYARAFGGQPASPPMHEPPPPVLAEIGEAKNDRFRCGRCGRQPREWRCIGQTRYCLTRSCFDDETRDREATEAFIKRIAP